MPEANLPEGYVDVEEAAARLGVSRTKVWRLLKQGLLVARPDVLDRRRKLLAVEDLERLLAGRAEGDSTERESDVRKGEDHA